MLKGNIISRKSAKKKGATSPQPREVGQKIQSRREDLLSPEQELDDTKSKYAGRPERLTHPDLNSDHDDAANLVRNVDAAMVIVDKSLRICRFTPSAAEILSLISPDIGRPITDLPSASIFALLESMIRDAMAKVTTKEQEVTDVRGVWHSLRVRPYMSRANKVEGAVLIVDSVFAFRPEYNDLWDCRIWLDVDSGLARRRGVSRDAVMEGIEEATRLHRDRYHAAEMIYLAEVRPRSLADVVIDNRDFANPRILGYRRG